MKHIAPLVTEKGERVMDPLPLHLRLRRRTSLTFRDGTTVSIPGYWLSIPSAAQSVRRPTAPGKCPSGVQYLRP